MRPARSPFPPRKTIFDPVHGTITLDAHALALVGTPEFQRLWGVRQTGFAHLVFPGANHTRLEHSLGTYWVARQYSANGPRPLIPVYGPRGTAERIAGFGGESTAAIQARFAVCDLAPGPLELGPFRLTADHVNHPVETFGFRVEHDGWRLAYSADTGESDALVRLAEGADLLLCEASFLDGPDSKPNLHLSGRQAAEYAERAGVGRLVLTHLVPWNDRERTLSEASAVYRGPLSLASSGLVLGPGHPGARAR